MLEIEMSYLWPSDEEKIPNHETHSLRLLMFETELKRIASCKSIASCLGTITDVPPERPQFRICTYHPAAFVEAS